MPGSADTTPILVDTSVAVSLVVADHEHHEATRSAIGSRTVGLAGHASFETFSVLTRLPPESRRSPATIARLLSISFPATCFLSSDAPAALLGDLAAAGIAGGSVYDALVGAAAREAGLVLVTRDRRALPTYRALGVRVEMLPAPAPRSE